jgi:hypothetical protein
MANTDELWEQVETGLRVAVELERARPPAYCLGLRGLEAERGLLALRQLRQQYSGECVWTYDKRTGYWTTECGWGYHRDQIAGIRDEMAVCIACGKPIRGAESE